MANQHTPGPWDTLRCTHSTSIVSNAPQLEGGDCTVASCHDMRPGDARLIAAAPELLAALREIEGLHPMTGTKRAKGIARAVLAKLEG